MKQQQADLFGTSPEIFTRRGASIVPPTREEVARARRDDGIGRAIDHADAVLPSWSDGAFLRFSAYARTHQFFTTEDVRESFSAYPRPPDARSWGGIAVRARSAGLVVKHGKQRAKSPSVHCMDITVWRSTAFPAPADK